MIGFIIGLSVVALLLILILTVVIRTLCFKPKESVNEASTPVSFNAEKAIGDLAQMVKCKTISNVDKSLEDEEEFKKFKELFDSGIITQEEFEAKKRELVDL